MESDVPLGSKPWQCLNQHHDKKKSFTWTVHLNHLVSSLEFWLGRKLNQGQLCVWPFVPRASHLEGLAFFQCSAVAVMKFLMIKEGPCVFTSRSVPQIMDISWQKKYDVFWLKHHSLWRKEALISREENVYRFPPLGKSLPPRAFVATSTGKWVLCCL